MVTENVLLGTGKTRRWRYTMQVQAGQEPGTLRLAFQDYALLRLDGVDVAKGSDEIAARWEMTQKIRTRSRHFRSKDQTQRRTYVFEWKD